MTLKMTSIGPSHYCEKARWALDLAGFSYTDDPHAPFFHVPYVKLAGGKSSTPILKTPNGVLTDSTDILQWIQDQQASKWRPYPEDNNAKIRELEDEFDEVLGPHTRRLAYHHLLPNRELALQTIGGKNPNFEIKVINALYDQCVNVMRKGMRIDDEGAARSIVKVDEVFERVAQRISDGREYLMNDTLTAADVTFAALAAPLLLPEKYSWPLPTVENAPASYRDLVSKLRAHPAGQFAMRIYEQHR